MTIEAKKEYLKAIRKRYQESSKSEKTAILNEFCEVCRYSRKYAIRLLKMPVKQSSSRPGPSPIYDDKFCYHLARLWKSLGNICSKKMVAAIPIWLPFYRSHDLDKQTKNKLLSVSSATIDRCLKKYKDKKGLSATRSSCFKNKIPLQLLKSEDLQRPGFIEADTVAHCGQSLSGAFAWTLTMTDLHSGWTENRATWTKDSYNVLQAIIKIEDNLPFFLNGFACDNGTEFLNENLLNYFTNRPVAPIDFVRRRPYKKNDNAHVEQKNFTHVRQIFGYDRIDQKELLELMNDIYEHYWNPLHNHFIPSLKLKEKCREGARVKKYYEEAKTPYQRLMESDSLTMYQKEALQKEHESLNPFKVRKILDEKLKVFYRIIDTRVKLVA